MGKIIIFLKPYSKYLLVAWIVIVIGVSSIPNLPTPKISTGKGVLRLDYIFHFCEYGFMAFLTLLAFVRKDFSPELKKYLLITFCLIVFAIADEYHQKLIPGRSFNLKDILSNVGGIVAATIFVIIVFSSISKKIYPEQNKIR